MNKRKVITATLLGIFSLTTWSWGANPIIADQGVSDPHMHVFNNRAYVYAGHDTENKIWNMPDWQVWSSADLVEWKKESVLKPEDTYIGKPYTGCWATDAAERNGKFYFYFSHCTTDTGVAVSDSPGGPFVDKLRKPILPYKLTPTKSYDPTAFIDDDEKKMPYIVFGTPVGAGGDSYYIGRLNEDMVSLAETPKKIILQNPDGTINKADDKSHFDFQALTQSSGLRVYTKSWGEA